MWHPIPLLLPYEITTDHHRVRSSMSLSVGLVQLQMVPYYPYSYQNRMFEYPGHRNVRKFLIDSCSTLASQGHWTLRSIFDLVKVTQFLELTDPKLLDWYLTLPIEDKKLIQEEGGLYEFLQRHPVLEVTRQLVYVKQELGGEYNHQTMSSDLNRSRRPTFYGVSQCVNCGTSCPSGVKQCRRCNQPIHSQLSGGEKLSMEINSKDLRRELNLFGNSDSGCSSGDGVGAAEARLTKLGVEKGHNPVNLQESFQSACDRSFLAEQAADQQEKAQLLSQLWEEGTLWLKEGGASSSNEVVYKDPSSQASFSLDMELEKHSKRDTTEVVSHTSSQKLDGYIGSEDTTGTHSLLYYPMIDQEQPPEGYSYASACMDCSEWNGPNHTVEPQIDDLMMATRGSSDQTSPEETPSGLADANSDMSFYADYSVDYCHEESYDGPFKTDNCPMQVSSGAELNFKCEDEDYHSIMEEDQSIVMCRTINDVVPRISGVHSAPATPVLSRPRYFCPPPVETSCAKPATVERSTSALPPAATFSVCVGTDRSLWGTQEVATQTQSEATAEKHVITEVHMADLDYLHAEFIKLKYAHEELQDKMASADGATKYGGCGVGGHCDQAQRAELRLLALQFGMCQQHCWRHYYTSPEGDNLLQRTEDPPEVLGKVLQALQSDYREMRAKIQAGVPLDQLKPLSVDSPRITTSACYMPSQIIGEVLESGPSGVSERRSQQLVGRKVEGKGEGSKTAIGPISQLKVDGSSLGGAVSLLGRLPRTTTGYKPGTGKELNAGEAWYDAEEDLGQAVSKGAEGARPVGAEGPNNGNFEKEDKTQQSLLCLKGLFSNVTEGDLMMWLEKYQPSKVSITALSNKMRVAMVTVNGPLCAGDAVREKNGSSLQGHLVHVTHIERPGSGNDRPSQSQAESQTITASHKPKPSGDTTRAKGFKTSFNSASVRVVRQHPLRSKLEKRTVICDSPTATGTCVPQHYATMGSFDTLMARLSERHPEMGRQRIVDALLKLKAQHQGYLSGLPLADIVEMTSDLLTGSTDLTQ